MCSVSMPCFGCFNGIFLVISQKVQRTLGLKSVGVTALLLVAVLLYIPIYGPTKHVLIEETKYSDDKYIQNGLTNSRYVVNKTSYVELPANYIPADDTKKISFLCDETFNRTFEDNLNVIRNYPRGIADQYLYKIGINKKKPDTMRKFPVFVTAFDNFYYYPAQNLFRSIHENFLANPRYGNDVLIIVYDLGMSSMQYHRVKKKCKCEIRRFPFEQYPPHVRQLKTYAFKPIIVHQVLMEYGFLFYVDSSIRFTTNNIDSALAYAKQYSLMYKVTLDKELTITKQTNPKTFEYLREDRCKFRPFHEILAGVVIYHYDKISRAVVQAWVTCALNKDCIVPPGSNIYCDFDLQYDGRCHRYDQSVLGIITRRLFHEQNVYPLDYNLTSIYKVVHGDLDPYFV